MNYIYIIFFLITLIVIYFFSRNKEYYTNDLSNDYIHPPIGLYTCEDYLKNFINICSDNDIKVPLKTKEEFINWCHSYRRRLQKFPTYTFAKDKFLQFNHENNITKVEPFSSKYVYPNRSEICGVYIDTFSNAHSNITTDTQYKFLKWCEGYKNDKGFYPSYRFAEKVFNSLIYTYY